MDFIIILLKSKDFTTRFFYIIIIIIINKLIKNIYFIPFKKGFDVEQSKYCLIN